MDSDGVEKGGAVQAARKQFVLLFMRKNNIIYILSRATLRSCWETICNGELGKNILQKLKNLFIFNYLALKYLK